MKTQLTIGTRVAYSANFLRSIGCYSGALPFLRGTITALNVLSPGCTLADIEWDGDKGEGPTRVNVANLAKVGSAAMSAN